MDTTVKASQFNVTVQSTRATDNLSLFLSLPLSLLYWGHGSLGLFSAGVVTNRGFRHCPQANLITQWVNDNWKIIELSGGVGMDVRWTWVTRQTSVVSAHRYRKSGERTKNHARTKRREYREITYDISRWIFVSHSFLLAILRWHGWRMSTLKYLE